MLKQTGGGAFDPNDRHIYFRPCNPIDLTLTHRFHRYVLIAVNELQEAGASATEAITQILQECPTLTLFLDSGVFSLASAYAAANNITHDEALRTPLKKITGFNELFDDYISLVRRWDTNLWGYVEIDIGGVDQKRETRARLEGMGLAPIPVYHPLNDGWDYFDELASQYDRICVGNVVRASRYVRKRIIDTIFERKKAYPGLWVHMLGMTPNEVANAFPMESCDSIYWLRPVKWTSAWCEKAAQRQVENFPRGFFYALGDSDSWQRTKQLSADQSLMNQINWRALTGKMYRGLV